MASAHFEQRVSAMQKFAAQYLPHLTSSEQTGLTTFVDCLSQHYGANLLHVVLFGSKARGDSHDQSDLDVLVVVRIVDNEYWQHWHEIVDIAWEVGLAYDLVVSPVVKSEHAYMEMCKHQTLLARQVEREGVALWTTRASASPLQPT